MYPARDFRSLIEQNSNDSIRAATREPLSELLDFWEKTNKPIEKFIYYNQGIKEAISKGRYPYISLKLLEDFPEFYVAVKDGLSAYWLTLRFSLSYEKTDSDILAGPSLFIDSILGEDVEITRGDKLNILQTIGKKYSFPLNINGKEYLVGVFPSKQAEIISQKFHWLQEVINISENISDLPADTSKRIDEKDK